MYVFPGIGLGAILSKAVNVTQDMIYASGVSLSESLTPAEKAEGWLYPDIRRIREVSVVVTRGVIRTAQKNGVDRELSLRGLTDDQLDDYIRERMYDPSKEAAAYVDEISQFAANGKAAHL
jgi:malate dehydrogenase (oxaloacetate-decarboxylating)(NADP+)